MNKPRVHTLIKFGSLENILQLQKQGEVYMNTCYHFKEIESNCVQGDRDEGLDRMHQVANGAQMFVEVNGKMEPISNMFGQIKFWRESAFRNHLFCMFALTDDSIRFLDDPRLLTFGDAALVLLAGDEFLAKLRAELNKQGIEYATSLVEYIDKDSHEGEVGPFRKISSYAYQSEFRVFAKTGLDGPFKIYIGDISGISVVIPTLGIKDRFTL